MKLDLAGKKFGMRPGLSDTNEYKIWQSMIKRCSNVRDRAFKRYGGRGIKVCDRWKVFENFFGDMGLRPSSQHSIDRIDNDGNYEPSNCRWATREMQANNTRANVIVSYNGELMTLTQARRKSETLIPKMTIVSRVNRGLSFEEAIDKKDELTLGRVREEMA